MVALAIAIIKWFSLGVLFVVVVFLLGLYARGAFRWRPLFHIENMIAPCEPRFLSTIGRLTEALEATGQIVDVWQTVEQIQKARLEAVNSAQYSIQFETFMMTPGRRAEAFADAIAKRALEGVTIQLLVDNYGARALGERYWHRLGSVGVQVVFFNPFDWRAPANYAGRTHRKLLIIDGRRALIGGAGISDLWDGTEKPDDTKAWFDIEVAITGEVVTVLSTIFQKHWQGYRKQYSPKGDKIAAINMDVIYPSKGEKTDLKQAESYQPASRENSPFMVIPGTKPSYRNSPIEILKQSLISSARQSIWLCSPYFLPNESTRNLLIEAQKAGIQVRILTTSDRSDKKPVYYASYEVYGSLLSAGISIFEYQPSMLHAKMLMIDHTWVNTGSANLDYRSYLHNDELDILTNSPKLVSAMKKQFERGFSNSQQIDLAQWQQRSVIKHRLIGNAVRLVQWQL
ncbi:MAG: phosphatidylserine/phosphatidylglycerophosphate/cardiolipin synthase family protein [Cyanobacteria bacterium J06626_6]